MNAQSPLVQSFHDIHGVGVDPEGYAKIDAFCRSLLHSAQFVVFDHVCRFLELEFYHYSASHPDSYTHRDKIQSKMGKWYFHRSGNSYKSGSFKGLDFTFGGEDAFGGVLIRSIQTDESKVICGPSLCVDFLIQQSGLKSVKELDPQVYDKSIWDPENSMRIESCPQRDIDIYSSARVGLSVGSSKERHRFVMRRYRFLTETKEIKKGRAHLILALHQDGYSVDDIRQISGSPKKTIEGYIEAVKEGENCNIEELYGSRLGSRELCLLEGYLRKQGE